MISNPWGKRMGDSCMYTWPLVPSIHRSLLQLPFSRYWFDNQRKDIVWREWSNRPTENKNWSLASQHWSEGYSRWRIPKGWGPGTLSPSQALWWRTIYHRLGCTPFLGRSWPPRMNWNDHRPKIACRERSIRLKECLLVGFLSGGKEFMKDFEILFVVQWLTLRAKISFLDVLI